MIRLHVATWLILACLLLATTHPAQTSEMIARYPLHTDALDATGNYDPITLENAPFEGDGVYCNGIYPDDPDGCLVQTPWIDALDFESFAISIEFTVAPGTGGSRPIIVGGRSYRWMGVEHDLQFNLVLLYNNSNRVTTEVAITPDIWHHAFFTYDGATNTGSLYFDYEFVTSVEFELDHGSYRNVTTTNFASGMTFLGHIRDLCIYDAAFVPTPVEGTTWGKVKASFR